MVGHTNFPTGPCRIQSIPSVKALRTLIVRRAGGRVLRLALVETSGEPQARQRALFMALARERELEGVWLVRLSVRLWAELPLVQVRK